ncbi:FAD-binding protein [Rhodococcus sp. BP-252]|uniref:D-arabinono-1,4-lactone oxidase n=1 Tax=unclassified Rhodococcus (in: high G+C Gram-positive bacteria) TaxID=192944 RepID=UPI001C9B89DC|nr:MULTISPECIES: D-arabinono-1,4-lactone oxidase [unclassified Rhodococcus (in: high G+C Gram-positive bacteria)]MBY6411567.1 FAD-binding protein [Rhodococcus sp. BP-320]MBY6417949.1 FAD-binding protein [Rhodococcus sp. BP-321]MBY6422150.1 FAD-binding protein [Rhodococcus sp. BP-324]MBY6427747.1 FAD-binding protein [Rhodococcus sp. BP-323]MBY6433034.1 FAD-binding protein [Rhodococcus sp. BP-322]
MNGVEWRNWAGNQSARPQEAVSPKTVEEVRRTVFHAGETGLRVKCVGAGHSFTSIAVTDGILVDLDRLQGIESVVPMPDGSASVTVFAGTRLRALNAWLWDLGLAMTNLGDIDEQSIAGAISTGTHGTGRRFGGIATQVQALEMVTADGSVVTCSRDSEPDMFDAARVGLGALGIITKVTLRCEPAFALHAVEAPSTLTGTLSSLPDVVEQTDHFEFYWFPHTDRVLTKTNTRLPADSPLAPLGRVRAYLDDELLANRAFEIVNRAVTRFPAAIPRVNAFSSRALSAREFTDRSYRVFASSRTVRFREMEYAVPAESITYVVREVDRWLQSSGFAVAFPVEVRFAAADDIWLSTANGRDSAYVAVHQYHRREHREYFDAVEKIARSVGGRPHWGKLHSQTANDFAEMYEHFGDFVAMRDKLDPGGMFGNEYLAAALHVSRNV